MTPSVTKTVTVENKWENATMCLLYMRDTNVESRNYKTSCSNKVTLTYLLKRLVENIFKDVPPRHKLVSNRLHVDGSAAVFHTHGRYNMRTSASQHGTLAICGERRSDNHEEAAMNRLKKHFPLLCCRYDWTACNANLLRIASTHKANIRENAQRRTEVVN